MYQHFYKNHLINNLQEKSVILMRKKIRWCRTTEHAIFENI